MPAGLVRAAVQTVGVFVVLVVLDLLLGTEVPFALILTPTIFFGIVVFIGDGATEQRRTRP